MHMASIPSKNMLILCILDVLQKYTDEEHTLSQKEIQEILQKEYNLTVERKAVKRNLMDLIACEYNLGYTETTRMARETDPKTGEVSTVKREVLSDFYLKRDFTDSELRLLIDSLLFSGNIPYVYCKDLIEKLQSLSSIYFKSKVRHAAVIRDGKGGNKQLFNTIDILEEAIAKGKQVTFTYCEYGTDKQLHRRRRPDGSIREYLINPYQMAIREGQYYLICNHDRYDSLSNYRVDRIRDIALLDAPVKPFERLQDAGGERLDLQKYMREHIYMYSSENVRTRFVVKRSMVGDIIDLFGTDVTFSDETDTHVTVTAFVNEMAMRRFAKSYAPDVVVLAPQSLTDQIKADLRTTLALYEGAEG